MSKLSWFLPCLVLCFAGCLVEMDDESAPATHHSSEGEGEGEIPANDKCGKAISVFNGVPISGTTLGATGVSESSCGYYDSKDVWYSRVPSSNGQRKWDAS